MHIGAGHVHQSYKLDCAFSPTDAYVLCGSEDGEQVEVASWFPWQLQGAVLHVYLIHAPVPAVPQGLIVCNLPCLLLFCILGAEREEASSAGMAAAAAAGLVPRNGLLVIPSPRGCCAAGQVESTCVLLHGEPLRLAAGSKHRYSACLLVPWASSVPQLAESGLF